MISKVNGVSLASEFFKRHGCANTRHSRVGSGQPPDLMSFTAEGGGGEEGRRSNPNGVDDNSPDCVGGEKMGRTG